MTLSNIIIEIVLVFMSLLSTSGPQKEAHTTTAEVSVILYILNKVSHRLWLRQNTLENADS